jgi:aspartyl protease family protein
MRMRARWGLIPTALVYLGRAQTANGTVAHRAGGVADGGAWPLSRQLTLRAWVNQGEMEMSLLGMEYLSLYRVEIAGDRMILRR